MHKRSEFQLLRITIFMAVLGFFSLSFALAQTRPKIKQIDNKMLKAVNQPPGTPDLTISNYELTRQGSTLNFTITCKNIGDGPAGCFNWRAVDSLNGIKMGEVCEGKPANWKLMPGQEVTVKGEVRRSEMWVWPDERGYMSKLRFNINHGSQVNEKDITNNFCQFKVIYWDQNIIQNSY